MLTYKPGDKGYEQMLEWLHSGQGLTPAKTNKPKLMDFGQQAFDPLQAYLEPQSEDDLTKSLMPNLRSIAQRIAGSYVR